MTGPGFRWAIWPLLWIAFSPVLLDLLVHLRDHPWARSCLVFPWLTWVAVRTADGDAALTPRPRVVWLALFLALLLEIVAAGGDAVRLARVGLLIGLVGVVWGAGWARLPTALLLGFAIPVPSTLLGLASPTLESMLGRLVGLLPGIGFELSRGTPIVTGGGGRIELAPLDGGVVLMIGLAGLGWFRAVAHGADLRGAARGAIGGGLLAAPIQLGLILATGGLLALTGAGAALRGGLDHASWLVVLGAGLLLGGIRLRAGRMDPGGVPS